MAASPGGGKKTASQRSGFWCGAVLRAGYFGAPPSRKAIFCFGLAAALALLRVADGAGTAALAGSYGLRNHGSTFSRRPPLYEDEAPATRAGRSPRSRSPGRDEDEEDDEDEDDGER